MKNKAKKYGNVLAFIPFILFSLYTILFFSLNNETIVASSVPDHIQWVATITQNYSLLWVSLGIACAVTAIIIIYYTVHVARLKSMPAGEKLFWLAMFPAFGAFALMLFWYVELRNEPEYIDVYPDIA